jgi:16S rRNA G966 N2-methylase RsmD
MSAEVKQRDMTIKYLENEIQNKIKEIIEKNVYIEELERRLKQQSIISRHTEIEKEEEQEDTDDVLFEISEEEDDDENVPWRVYTTKELQNEYTRLQLKLKETIKCLDPIPFSAIGCKCTNFFFQYERLNTPSIWKTSSVEYWKINKHKVKLFNKNKNDLYNTLNLYNRTPGQFQVLTAGKMYKYFNATKIFDPYAGWGDRCLAAMALNLDYVGVDSNTNLEEPYKKICESYKTKGNVQMFFQRSETVDLETIEFDFVFSSPPFWKSNQIVENYNNCDNNYPNFMRDSLVPIMEKCLARNAWVCLYIPENMYNDLLKPIGECQQLIRFKTCSTRYGNIYCWKKDTLPPTELAS